MSLRDEPESPFALLYMCICYNSLLHSVAAQASTAVFGEGRLSEVELRAQAAASNRALSAPL